MAQDLEQMVLSISADTRQIMRAMKKLETDSGASTKKIERQFDGLGKKINGTFAGVNASASGMLKGLVAAFSIREATRLIDTSTRIDNALKVAGLSGAELTKVYDALFVSAQKNAAPLEALVQLYGRASLVQKELGVSTEQLLKFTDNVAVALRVSGKSAAESSGALLQLSQALGSGVVRAEEFNSMLEGALPIVQAAANGITEAGGSVSKLRQLVVDGKVSSAAFFKGFQAGAVMLNQQVAGATMTVSQGFERLQNVMIDAAHRLNETTGASKAAGSTLDNLALAVERLAGAFGKLAEKASDSSIVNGVSQIGQAADDLWKKPSFRNLIKFLLDPSGEGAVVGSIGETPFEQIAQRSIDLDRKLVTWQKELADARAIASLTGLDTDKERVKTIERQVGALKDESALLARRTTDAATARPVTAPKTEAPKKISLKDNPVTAKPKKTGTAGDQDTFERRMAMTQRQIDLMGVEASTIDQTAAARERARVVVELETAAKRANEQAGLKNTEVTAKQRETINTLADAYAKARGQLEQLNGPLATFARESADVGKQLEQVAVHSLDRMSDEFADVITGTKSVGDAFKSMSNLIISELARIAIKKAVLGPLASMMGGGGNILSSLVGGTSAASYGAITLGGPAGPTPFADGGYTGPGGKYQPAGTVHKGEYVFDADSVRAAGGPAVLDAMRKGLKGYASGGYVDAPAMPRLAAPSSGGTKSTINIVDNVGVKVEAREVVDGRGNRRVDVTLDEAVAASLSRPGSGARGAMRSNFGAKPVGVRR